MNKGGDVEGWPAIRARIMATDVQQPWDRRDGESLPAWEAFIRYRDLGPGRSSDAVGKELGKSGGLCERWSARWEWVARCRAWDAHMAAVEQRGRERALEASAEEWARRRLKIREDEWEVSQALVAKVKGMLSLPLVTRESADGKTVVKPGRWGFRDTASMIETASKLARLAARMEDGPGDGADAEDLPAAVAEAMLDAGLKAGGDGGRDDDAA